MASEGVTVVYMDGGYVVVGDEVLPVTDWMGPDGEDCDPEEATSCVAGPDARGHWLTIGIDPQPVLQ